MLHSGAWPKDMEYLKCDDFQGGNTPERNIDLRQYFTQVCLLFPQRQLWLTIVYKICVIFLFLGTFKGYRTHILWHFRAGHATGPDI